MNLRRICQVITRNNQLRTTLNILNVHPETGETFSVKGHRAVDLITGDATENFRVSCIRPAT